MAKLILIFLPPMETGFSIRPTEANALLVSRSETMVRSTVRRHQGATDRRMYADLAKAQRDLELS